MTPTVATRKTVVSVATGGEILAECEELLTRALFVILLLQIGYKAGREDAERVNTPSD